MKLANMARDWSFFNDDHFPDYRTLLNVFGPWSEGVCLKLKLTRFFMLHFRIVLYFSNQLLVVENEFGPYRQTDRLVATNSSHSGR